MSQGVVKILFFGATKDVTKRHDLELEFQHGSLFKHLLDRIAYAYPKLASYNLLLSINQQYANGDELLHDGDEIAIFTAVSGG